MAPPLHVRVESTAQRVVLQFDAHTPGRMMLSAATARGLAQRLQAAADRVDPRPSRNGGRPR